ncbi:hypothetical protein OAC91_02065 [Candidatus Marinimicrobia bacterium]|nr:hypothetical protein [Candidatus Neomarinimicrobiota bacterium]
MHQKRISKKNQDILQSLLFFVSTMITISGLIIYLWVYTEIDESLLAIEIQKSTANELKNEINELNNVVEFLLRADIISKKATSDLKMVYTEPETLIVNYDFEEVDTL